MPAFDRSDLPDLAALAVIARRQSFKAAAIELDVTASALSHAMRRLESKLGVKLLNRSSRSVAPTAAGMQFVAQLDDGFDRIADAVGEIGLQTGRPLGDLRLNVPQDAATLLIGPVLAAFSRRHPDMRLTIVVENRPIDIVAEGYDAGIRYGDTVPEDMVAVALTPPLDWIVVGSPAYLAAHGRPAAPADLAEHVCLQLQLGDKSRFRWELGKGKAMLRLDVPGHITINDTQATIDAAVGGVGLGYVLGRRVAAELASGALEQVLPDWASPGPGFHVYYPSRRQMLPAMRLLINLVRVREGLAALG